MLKNLDIESAVNISGSLFHNLTNYVIPVFCKSDKNMHNISIRANVTSDDYIREGTHVGTAISCGVDALHAVWHYLDYPDESYRLTHLSINNVGALCHIGDNEGGLDIAVSKSFQRAKQAADLAGLPLIEINTNAFEVLKQPFLLVNTYNNIFCVLMLRYFWKKYYIASAGYSEVCLDIIDCSEKDPAHFELFLLPYLSSPKLQFFSEGTQYNR